MKRRSVLTALGASILPLSGCAELGRGDVFQRSSSKGSPTPIPVGAHREVQISGVDDVPADAPLKPSVTVVHSRVTADQTARIRITVQNVVDQPVYTEVLIPAFSAFVTQTGPGYQRLVLLRPDRQYDTANEWCWRAELDRGQLNHLYGDIATHLRYGAGESKSTAFDIYGHPENPDPCLVPGDYPIENRYTISDDADSDEATWQYNWGFTITVAES